MHTFWISTPYRNLENDHCLCQSFPSTHFLHHENTHSGQWQQQAHLDIETRAVEKAAKMPLIPLVAEDCKPQAQNSKAVVKTSQHENTMQSL